MKPIALVAVVLALVGCSEPIDVPNRAGSVASVDAVVGVGNQVAVDYVLEDPEGDDLEIVVEVCQEDGSACGWPLQGSGGDGTTRLPTGDGSEPSPHRFVWAVGCGRIVGEAIVATQLDLAYIVRVRLAGTSIEATSDGASSEPFSLGDANLNYSMVPDCDR